MSHELTTLLAQVSSWEAHVIQALTKANTRTVERWLKGKQLPNGELRVRLNGALEYLGYVRPEYNALPEPARRLTVIITFDVLSVEDIVEHLGYSSASMLYRVLLEGTGLMQARATKMVELTDEYWTLTEETIQKWDLEQSDNESPTADTPTAPPRPELPRFEPSTTAQAVSHLIQALNGLAASQADNTTFYAEVASLTPSAEIKAAASFLVMVATE